MSSALVARGFKTVVACSPHGELHSRAKQAGLTAYRFCISNLSFLNPFKVFQVVRMLRYCQADTLIVNLPSDLKVAGLAARLAGGIRVIYRRGSAIPVRNSLSNRLIFKYLLDDILVNSKETARTILANNPVLFPARNIHVIYNGIDLAGYDHPPGIPPHERQGNEVILACAGRLSRQKGYDLLFEALSKLKKTGIGFKLLLAGDGELKEEILQQASETGLLDHIVFLGFMENIKPLLDASDIFLLPSRWEGFGYVLVEAMACRKPVIAFHTSSNPEIVADGETGFLVKDFNTDEFAEMIFFLANQPELRKQMGEKGRKRVEDLFVLEKAVRGVEGMLSAEC
jgi:glycosyltransferase involved in cell wall biosynthesis